MKQQLHHHVIVDAFSCRKELLYWNSSKEFRHHIRESVSRVANVLAESWHEFPNGAYTGTILLAESHFSIHTWPESTTANLDLFTCGEHNPELAMKEILTMLDTSSLEDINYHVFHRFSSHP